MPWLSRLFRPRWQPGFPERRASDRLIRPICPRCHTRDDVRAQKRTSMTVYFECANCGEVVPLPKPKTAPS